MGRGREAIREERPYRRPLPVDDLKQAIDQGDAKAFKRLLDDGVPASCPLPESKDSWEGLHVNLHQTPEALATILRVGTSAGGARAKAVISWNPRTGKIRSGQLAPEPGFEPWLLKFDGVSANRDKELNDPLGYSRIEYAYHLMARAAGISMSNCRLLEENGRAHFMTRRFDRDPQGRKFHIQSLCGIAHFDFNQAGAYSYEQAFQTARQLSLPQPDLTELFRRAVFNIVSRNQDDHTKNIAFRMDRRGVWQLARRLRPDLCLQPDRRMDQPPSDGPQRQT